MGRVSELVSELLPEGPDTDPEDYTHRWPGERQRLATSLALARGDVRRAREWVSAHDRWMEATSAVLGMAEGELLRGEIARAAGDIETAWNHGYRALERASDPVQPLSLIRTHRLLGELAVHTGDPETSERHLTQSQEIVDACALPYERALTVLARAELEHARGEIEVAKELLAEARRTFAELGAKPALERVRRLESTLKPGADGSPYRLSPRELEILQLVARGMSDKDIAEELYISPHTVIRHVASIRGKLNVDSRAGAAAEAVRQGIV